MNSRERIRLALEHKEPDHVPMDLGGTAVSLIHRTAYKNLREYLSLPVSEPQIIYVAEQIVIPE